MGQYQILIVEDEKEINDAIEIYLVNQGYKVFKAFNGQQGLDIINKEDIHLAIVDMMMPVMNGTAMIMKVRERHDFPIIVLSAKSEDIDKITNINIGADDYITKPFTPMELLARINSQLRRYQRFLDLKNVKESTNNRYIIKGLECNLDTKEVLVDGEQVKITPLEFKILLL
ncbi:MAG: response regulator transcription factor, partial [Erysipelotrichaceae bacterium]